MKSLILVRHAKSSWKENNLPDFKRPLNKRGKRDAPFMGKLLKKMDIKPDYVISSPALRAAETARIICMEMGISEDKIRFDEDIYAAGDDDILEVINSVSDEVNVLMVFGHNPGLTDLSNLLSDRFIDNIPTAGVVILNYNSGKWSELHSQSCVIKHFEYPKKYFSKDNDE
jgi:phosphohistidine phosphatase